MGIDGRKKSILASFHGRYHTIGVADLRAVSTDMSPLYSGGVRSRDSEAMNKIGKLLRDEPTLGRVMASKKHNVGLSLIAAELVISVAGLYHTLNGWSAPESPFNLSDIRLFIPA